MTRTRTDKGSEEAERDKTLCVCLLFHLIKYFSHFAAILRLLHCVHLIEWYLLHIYSILTQRWRSHWSRLWRASLWRYIRIQAILQVPLLLQLQLLCGRLALLPCNCLCRHSLSLSIAVAVDLFVVYCLLRFLFAFAVSVSMLRPHCAFSTHSHAHTQYTRFTIRRHLVIVTICASTHACGLIRDKINGRWS